MPLNSVNEIAYTLLNITATETQKTYLAMKQPPLHPPAWVFGPVWTILYGYISVTLVSEYHES